MATIKKGDFIELDYTGRLSEDNKVFDTTLLDVAEKEGFRARQGFRPTIICVGEGHLLPALDDFLVGKGLGKHSCSLEAERAFGKKDAKLLKLIPLQKFREAKVQPVQGLEVNIDGHYGVIRSVSGGRVTVDFNHPLAGKDVSYELDVKRVVEKKEEQAAALLEMMGLHHHGITMEGEQHLVIGVHSALPQAVAETVNRMVARLVKVKDISYHVDAAGHGHQ